MGASTQEDVIARFGFWLTTTAATLVTSCATAHNPTRASPAAGFVLSGDASIEVVRTIRTPSLALDRISKHAPDLDGTVRRTGSGRGVAIYVFDGGVSAEHQELAGRVRTGYDAFPSNPRVCNAHGTAVAGAAAGATLGVAPEAEIVDVKIIDCGRMRGSVAAILAASRWVAEDHARHPEQAAVVNWSFAVDTTRMIPEMDSAAAVLHDAGLLVVVAAGNFDIDACRVSPANVPRTLVVGASSIVRSADGRSWRDVHTSGTAWGACIGLYAPGDSVLLPNIERDRPTTTVWTGTSMAAGYVSGAASLVLEQNSATSPEGVIDVLMRRATFVVAGGPFPGPDLARLPLLYVGPTTQVIASAPRGGRMSALGSRRR